MSKANPTLVKPITERIDERGTLIEALNTGRWASLLCGHMKANAIMGNHYHMQTEVFLFLTSGRARVVWASPENGKRGSISLPARRGIHLQPKLAHAICYEEDSSFIILKSRPYSDDDPDTYPYHLV